MASKYLQWKYRNVKPEEKKSYTKEELRRNWWDYHKWHVIFGIIGAFILIDLFISMTGIGKPKPDLSVAIVCDMPLEEGTIQTITERFQETANDYNNDHKVIVDVIQYIINENADKEEVIYRKYASEVQLIADFEKRVSFLFIVEDANQFQKKYEILSKTDDTLPTSFEDAEGCYKEIKEISLLEDIEEIKDMHIAHRGFWSDKYSANYEESLNLWHKLIGE